MSTRTDGENTPETEAPAAAAPATGEAPAPEGEQQGDALGVDTTGAAGDPKDEPPGFFNRAGEFISENRNGLGAGLGAALMVGLIATAMGGGGIMAMILGLLAMMLVGGIVGSMRDDNSVAGPVVERAEKALGRGKAIEKTPGFENAIDVKEGEDLAVIRKDKNGKDEYLIGQDADGKLQYSADRPVNPLQLRMVNENGQPTGIIEGKVSADNSDFLISRSASAVARSDGSTEMTPLQDGAGSVEIGLNGHISTTSRNMDNARIAGRTAKEAYETPQEVALVRGQDNSVTAELGKKQITIGDKVFDTTVIAQGSLSEDGKTAVFEKAYLDYNGTRFKDVNGEDINVALPSGMTQAFNVSEGNTIAPMSGDVQRTITKTGDETLSTVNTRNKAYDKEAADIKSNLEKITGKDPEEVAANKQRYIEERWEQQLERAGVSNGPDNGYEAAKMAREVTKLYQNQDFRNKDATEAALEISEQVPGANRDIIESFARRNHETFSKAIGGGSGDEQSKSGKLDLQEASEQFAKSLSNPIYKSLEDGTNVNASVPGGSGGRER